MTKSKPCVTKPNKCHISIESTRTHINKIIHISYIAVTSQSVHIFFFICFSFFLFFFFFIFLSWISFSHREQWQKKKKNHRQSKTAQEDRPESDRECFSVSLNSVHEIMEIIRHIEDWICESKVEARKIFPFFSQLHAARMPLSLPSPTHITYLIQLYSFSLAIELNKCNAECEEQHSF